MKILTISDDERRAQRDADVAAPSRHGRDENASESEAKAARENRRCHEQHRREFETCIRVLLSPISKQPVPTGVKEEVEGTLAVLKTVKVTSKRCFCSRFRCVVAVCCRHPDRKATGMTTTKISQAVATQK